MREHTSVRSEEPRVDGRLLVSPRKTEPHSQVCVCVCARARVCVFVCVVCVFVCVCVCVMCA